MKETDRLSELRKIINETDRKMAELFCRRMDTVKQIAQFKAERGLPVLDEGREAAVIEKNSAYISDTELRSYYINFLKDVMSVSRNYQQKLIDGAKIAYAGVEGAFAHIAAKGIFPGGVYMSFPDFEKAYRAVEDGICDCCVLPIENSYAGEVGQVTDLMFSGSLFVSGVYDLKVHQNLLGIPGARPSDIKTVISHPQALGQCEKYIRRHGFEQIEEKNTAAAAKAVADFGRMDTAAIASRDTAELYGLEIIDHDINESDGNTTRFAVFTRVENKSATGDSKFIMMFTVNNVPGSLAKAINIIGKHGFNMRVLRSRPVKNLSWQYYFYVEAEGNAYSDDGKKMLDELSSQCDKLKVAGNYAGEKKIDIGEK